MTTTTFAILLVIFLSGATSAFRIEGEECERDKSRTVREVIFKELLLLYKVVGAKIPYKCPFFKDRDLFLAHEEHKERESSARWACNYCGKVFIGEVYLDMHLANRHADSVYKEKDAVCLADFCEIFRCDVLSGVAKPTFWDLALCMEDDMQDLAQDCKDLMSECIPESMNWNSSRTLTYSLNDVVCSFLTCKNYYSTPVLEEKEPPRTSYVVMSVVLFAAMIIYYCVAVNYFWLDTFADVYDTDEYVGRGPESLFDPDNVPRISSLSKPRKKTIIQTNSSTGQDIFDMKKIDGLQSSVKKARKVVGGQRQTPLVESGQRQTRLVENGQKQTPLVESEQRQGESGQRQGESGQRQAPLVESGQRQGESGQRQGESGQRHAPLVESGQRQSPLVDSRPLPAPLVESIESASVEQMVYEDHLWTEDGEKQDNNTFQTDDLEIADER